MNDLSYHINDNSATTFENLYRLIMSASIKDYDKIYAAETIDSERFGRYLEKYYDDKLEQHEIVDLLSFINNYNLNIATYVYQHFYTKVFGINSTISKSSMIMNIANMLYEQYNSGDSSFADLSEALNYVIYHGFDICKSLLEQSIERTSDIAIVDGYYRTVSSTNYNIFDGLIKIKPDIFGVDIDGNLNFETSFEYNTIKKLYKNQDSWSEESDSSNEYAICLMNGDTISKTYYTNTIPFDNENITNNLKNRLEGTSNSKRDSALFISILQFLIHIVPLDASSDTGTKVSASEKEISLSTNRLPYSFIELHNITLSDDEKKAIGIIDKDGNAVEYSYISEITSQTYSNSDEKKYSFLITYKELNSQLRNDCYCAQTDLIYSCLVNTVYASENNSTVSAGENTFVIPDLFTASINSFQPTAISNAIKNITTIVYDNFSNFSSSTYNLFLSLKTNSYLARSMPESSIITYFAGSNEEFAFSYGDTTSEKQEINDFLETYEHVREYFYTVLSSKAFVNDDYYKAYEKLYISTAAILKTLDYKISNNKDIDRMNMEDIDNFLESYGLGILTTHKSFVNSEDYKRKIVKYYNDLMKNKGSKEVIDLLSLVFDVENTDVNIRKFELIKLIGDYQVFSNTDTDDMIYAETVTETVQDESGNDAKRTSITFKGKKGEETAGKYINQMYAAVSKNFSDTYNDNEILLSEINEISDNMTFTFSITYNLNITIDESSFSDYILDVVNAAAETAYIFSKDMFENVILEEIYNNTADNEYYFIKLPYTSDDELGEILSELDKKREYSKFIETDKYWTINNASKDYLNKLNISVTPTKYLALDMTKNIDETFIRAMYYFSVIAYCRNTFAPTTSNAKVELELGDTSATLSFGEFFDMCLLLYGNVCLAHKKLNKIEDPEDSENIDDRYYGINTEICDDYYMIRDVICDDDEKRVYSISDKCHPVMISRDNITKLATLDINTNSINETIFLPFLLNKNDLLLLNSISNETTRIDTSEQSEILYGLQNNRLSEIVKENITAAIKCKNSGNKASEIIDDLGCFILKSNNDLKKYITIRNRKEFYIEDRLYNNELSVDDYLLAIDNLIRFPIDYLSGLTVANINNNELLLNNDFCSWCDKIFNKLYTTTTNPLDYAYILSRNDSNKTDVVNECVNTLLQNENAENILKYILSDIYTFRIEYNNETKQKEIVDLKLNDIFENTYADKKSIEDLIVTVSEKLFKLISQIRSLFSSSSFIKWSFTNIEGSSDEFNFLQAAVEIFISYTVKLYEATLIRSYDSKFEAIVPHDQVKADLTMDLIDYVTLDDGLKTIK